MAKNINVNAWIYADDATVDDMADALRKIADQLEEGYTSGYYPNWELKIEEDEE